jgi:hypothetical protein
MRNELPLDYNEELERRITQFTNWLVKMKERRRKLDDEDCFLIFDEESPEPIRPVAHFSRAKSLVLAGGKFPNEGIGACDLEPPAQESGDSDERCGRFLQFCFESGLFWMDIPNTTLSKFEGDKIIQRRPGFFWLRQNPGYAIRLPKLYDPLTKFYIYGDEPRAAEDMAFIFFDFWKFPVTSELFIKAASFGDGPTFEWGLVIR